jgi:pimeloyl-ACP methyl ester carboxylesterase
MIRSSDVIHERTVDIGGERVRYLEAGAGWPLVLIHAFPLSAEMWRPQLERALDGWRFIAPDLRGFRPPVHLPRSLPSEGVSAVRGSERVPHPIHPSVDTLTMDDYARDIGQLLDCLKIDEAVIGGLSMGGYVTFALFRQSPERFSGMSLADTRPQADTPDGRSARAKMRDLLEARGPSAVADQMLPKFFEDSVPPPPADLVAHVRDLIEANAVDGLDAALNALMQRPDSTPDLDGISCPALIVVGEHDVITPAADARVMERAIPRARLTVIPGAGHLSSLEHPDEFSRALHDFLMAHM